MYAKPIWAMPEMLRIDALEAGYDDGGRVLHGLDLAVREGERVALMGRNGMGKTSLLRSVMGHLRLHRGSIRFGQQDISGLPTYRISNLGIAYVPQGREIFGDLTVEENLRLGLLGKRTTARTLSPFVFDRFPILATRRHQRAGTLSGGEQQQLAVARALVGRPRLLLLDEPSEGIQPSIVQSMAAALASIAHEEGIALVLVEHSLQVVKALAERCLFMQNGCVVAQGATTELDVNSDLVLRHLSV